MYYVISLVIKGISFLHMKTNLYVFHRLILRARRNHKMLFTANQEIALTYNDIQFAIAIVLDQCGETFAAKQILTFLRGDPARSVLIENLNKTAKRLKKDLVTITVKYYYENHLFRMIGSNSRIYQGAVKCTLGDISIISPETLIEKVEVLFAHNPVSKLLALYCHTRMFREQFFNRMRKVSQQRFGNPTSIGEDTIDQILADFISFVEVSDTAFYYTESCDPDSVLFDRAEKSIDSNNKRSGMLFFYMQHPKSRYNALLNAVGTESTISGTDNLTIYDTTFCEQLESIKINFNSVASKIQRASSLLFTHNKDKVAYYDIFSYHRQKVIERDAKAFSNLELIGCSINFQEDKDLLCGDNTTLKGKYSAICRLWSIFEELLSKNVSMEDLYSLYDHVYTVSEIEYRSCGGKDGKVLFSVADFTPKTEGTNGDKFFILLHGYMALKELLEFLESDSNKTGVNLYNFPVQIFRDASILYRVKSLDEYVKYGNEIMELCQQAKDSTEQLEISIDGVLLNDIVYSNLTKFNLLKNDSNVKGFMESPVSAISSSLEHFNQETSSRNVLESMLNLRLHFNTYTYAKLTGMCEGDIFYKMYQRCGKKLSLDALMDVTSLQSLQLGYSGLTMLNFFLTNTILNYVENMLKHGSKSAKECGDSFRKDLYLWYLLCAFANSLRAASLYTKDYAVHTNSGEYLLMKKNLDDATYVSPLFFSQDDRRRGFREKRKKVIMFSIWMFWGRVPFSKDILTSKYIDDIDSMDLWTYWNVVTKFNRYLVEYWKLIKDLNRITNDKDDNLLLVFMTAHLKILDLQNPLTSSSSLSVLKDLSDPSLYVQVPFNIYRNMINLKNKRLVCAFNLFFDNINLRPTKIFKNMRDTIDTSLGTMNSHSVRVEPNATTLTNARASILAKVMLSTDNYNIAQKLSWHAEFDDEGYLVKNGRRTLLRRSEDSHIIMRYVHSAGYFVEISSLNPKNYELVAITEEDLKSLF